LGQEEIPRKSPIPRGKERKKPTCGVIKKTAKGGLGDVPLPKLAGIGGKRPPGTSSGGWMVRISRQKRTRYRDSGRELNSRREPVASKTTKRSQKDEGIDVGQPGTRLRESRGGSGGTLQEWGLSRGNLRRREKKQRGAKVGRVTREDASRCLTLSGAHGQEETPKRIRGNAREGSVQQGISKGNKRVCTKNKNSARLTFGGEITEKRGARLLNEEESRTRASEVPQEEN